MNLLDIAFKDVLLLLRDRKALLTLLATPLVLTFVLGMAFSSMFSSDMPPSLVLYINHDTGEYGEMLFRDVFTLEGVREWVSLQEASSTTDAMQQVRRGRATAFIEIPADFSAALAAGNAEILVASDPASSIRANIVTQIVNRFAAELSSRTIIHSTLAAFGVPLPPEQIEEALASLELTARVQDGYEARQQEENAPVAIDYYTAGMGVMYLLFTVSYGATAFLQEREGHTLARMYQSPTRAWQIGAGKFVGIFAIAVLQISAVIAFSSVVFQASWGNWAGAALLTIAAAFAASGIGLLIAAVSKTQSAASALGTLIVLPMSVLGGSMMPIFAMPPAMRALSKLTMNGWAMDGYTRLMFEGAGVAEIGTHVFVLMLAGAALIGLAGSIMNRKGVTP